MGFGLHRFMPEQETGSGFDTCAARDFAYATFTDAYSADFVPDMLLLLSID